MTDALDLAVALGIGLMLGVERERRKAAGPARAPAGIRTFALVALLGGLAAQVGGTAIVAVALGLVGLAAIAAYVTGPREDPGMTSEIALLVAVLLGALAQSEPALAAGAAVVVALLLTYRERLHRLARDALSETELRDALLFAAAALVVLPLVPDEGVGPNEALNPFTVWRLVVLLMGLQGLGYVALRLIGPRLGLLVSGFVGGFASSTATVGAMGARARQEPGLRRGAVGAAVVSTVATIVLLAIVLAATSSEVLELCALPLALSGVAALAYAALAGWRAMRRPTDRIAAGAAFDLRTTVVLATMISLILLAGGALNELLGRQGVALGAAVAGFADSQSAAASASSLAGAGRLTAEDAVVPVLLALTTNSVSKAVVAYVLGGRRFAAEVGVGLVLVVGAAWAGWALTAVA